MGAGAILSPGDPALNNGAGTLSIGTAVVPSDLSLSGNDNLDFQVGAAGTAVAIYGNLELSGSDDVNISDGGDVSPGDYTLLSYTGSLEGNFSDLNLNSLPSGWNATLVNNTTTQTVVLNVASVPEPSTATMLVLASVAGVTACGYRAARRGTPR
jgi:hypothetical protein